jgi:hypothetical protein
MKNNRILKLVFACLVMAAVISMAPQGGTTPAAACSTYGPMQPGLQCPAWYITGGCWTCSYSYVVCDEYGECCCHYTPEFRPTCPQYCYFI